MLFDEILAQEGPIETLRRALADNRLAQAYLFEGPGGIGKEKTAMALASSMLCERRPEGCGRCEVCRRVAAGNHPDVRVFAPRDEGKGNIKVDFVRNEILPFAEFAPFEARAAFLVFPRADVSFPLQHAESANALLKTLEEPRSNLHFVLLSERPDRLLPTIRSRCQRLRFNRLSTEIVEGILESNGISGPALRVAAALAGGRADRALQFAEDDRGEQLFGLARHIDATLDRSEPGPLLDLAEELARDDDLALVLETLAMFYRDVAAAGFGVPTGELLFSHQSDTVCTRADRLGSGRAAKRVDLIFRTCENLERNANPEIALDAMLFELGSV
jgi:DNA polymerase-3 subunit delta'